MHLSDPNLFQQACFIDGQWVQSREGKTTSITNPYDNSVLGTVPELTAQQVTEAIASATLAQRQWAKQTAATRAMVLRQWFNLIEQHAEDLAQIMTLEQGKALQEAKGEITYAASFVEWFAEEAKRSYGEMVPTHKADARILVSREPIGVVAAITPWNFPAAMITRKCAPAFAAGCAVILKPAPETPFTALAFAELAKRAGLPAGLLQVVTGDAVMIGQLLTESPLIRKLSFTGSTRVGKILMAQSASNVKKLSLELGGNAPFIVFEDANINAAVEGAMIAKFRNAGQTCVCANRIYVHDSIYEQFTAKLIDRVRKLKVGNGLADGTQMGPLINDAAVNKVRSHIEDALEKGAKVAFGTLPEAGSRLFIPHVLTEMSDDMLVAHEETFGPLAALFRFSTEEEVIERANRSHFGLAAYCYTQSHARAWRMSEQLESGIVGINEGLISTTVAPFGGVKESGLGREGAKQGLEEYQEVKYTLMGGL
ncbi:NAD-dependent succinate-semialdehyde dehydrogenase [Vibrio cincinnatiensis]|uniref:NAD-dependent succinate-semialdehyde dehydrogenase n=1 Tax=Vibrio cincinnatiensis TaxID=675 RepID=UPI0012AC72DA|nr:NAD-dependent succinate-semialdehyde dehydrogenase [Vibrio cincinnatiensis]MCG3731298.1 NAD-dependent succinate-semialdehyde dehydrogenase [Vibrio cincinnatiensis]MCG3738811.1 NAD-dependent succinate-semialdehyde dehydrogenase [Vibrio cincinnatiensis]MCG3742335.1 NAD-dependent succinate-semialdehyde dehydrogenase [Vibrio cincinnatiensis]